MTEETEATRLAEFLRLCRLDAECNDLAHQLNQSNERNGRLIAQRDALLEALKAFANEIVPNNPNDPLWVNARAAIKAVEEGK